VNTLNAAGGGLLSAGATSALVRRYLAEHDEGSAMRFLTEATARLASADAAAVLPETIGEPEPTGDVRWDTLLAACFAYACRVAGLDVQPWMTAVAPLDREWGLGRHLAGPLADRIRAATPPEFRRVGIVCRPSDWTIR
jgi:hypothetical protein